MTHSDKREVFPEAKRLTTSIRYWIEVMISAGAKVACFAVANPGKDIFLEMLEIELELPSDRAIREVMEVEAQKHGLQIDKSRLDVCKTEEKFWSVKDFLLETVSVNH